MEWEKASAELSLTLANLLTGFACRKQAMFGSPVYFVNDNMFAGVKGGVVFLRLSADERKAIMEESADARPFEPRPGFFMKDYVAVSEAGLSDSAFILKWLRVSFEHVLSLPPKEKKAPKKK